MIHYMSADGVGSPWVANELRGVQLAGMPFALHALRMPTKITHEAEWARKMNDETSAIYPLSIPSLLLSLIAAPLLFRSRYLAALLWSAGKFARPDCRTRPFLCGGRLGPTNAEPEDRFAAFSMGSFRRDSCYVWRLAAECPVQFHWARG